MPDLNDVAELKDKVTRLQRDRDRASGALEEAMKSLAEEFGCKSLEEAEEKLEQMKVKEEDSRKRFETGLAEFRKTWAAVLGGAS